MSEPIWIPLRQYAEARGVMPAAILKTIKRGRLGVPYRRSNTDARGAYEILANLADAPILSPVPNLNPPVADRSETPPLDEIADKLAAVRAHLAAVETERDRLLLERNQERGRLEQARQDYAVERTRLQALVDSLSTRMADLAREAQRVGAAEAETATLRAEVERLKRRGWLARLLDL